MADRPLTPKQQRFVEAYLANGRNGAAAYRAAYGSRGSAQRAAEEAKRLLKHPKIAPLVEEVIQKAAEGLQVTAERVLAELARVAFLDPRRLMDWGPGGVVLRESSQLDEDTARCVAEASQTVTETGGTIRVKVCPKIDALKLLGQHLGLFKDGANVTVQIPFKVYAGFDPADV